MHLSNFWLSIPLAVAMWFGWSLNRCGAQEYDMYRAPGAEVGGNAGTELTNIRRGAIGYGYSGANINRVDLTRSSVSTPFIGGYNRRTIAGGINSNVGGPSPVSRPAASFGSLGLGGGAPASKPFSNASTGPTVSPYLNLFREGLDGFSDFNYQTLVRPQMQQMEVNSALQRQQQEISRRVQSLSARQAFNPQGSTQQMPTGHQTTFGNLSHYYPSAQSGQRRR